MIKRKTAAAFLVLAGILFLAHAVVPHHHHGNLICYAKSHCEGEDPAGNHESSPDNHHHDNDGCDVHCILKDPAVVGSILNSAGLKFVEKKSGHAGTDDITYCLSQDIPDQLWPEPVRRSLHPSPGFVYLSPTSPSTGLRAPPLV
jgi:hypothetical protein